MRRGVVASQRTLWGAIVAVAIIVTAGACETKGGGDGSGTIGPGAGTTSGTPSCEKSCPKSCAVDTDCPISEGQVCCSFGSDGNACVKASKCPRFCTADQECDTTDGEICCQTKPTSPAMVCRKAKECLIGCKTNDDCGEGSICCLGAAEPLCTPPEYCPKACVDGSECDSKKDEICCHSHRNYELAVWGYSLYPTGGVCGNVKEVPCRTPCSSSKECPEKTPICCTNGFCDESCEQPCATNNDCNLSDGEFCCGSQVRRSPWYDD